MITLTKNENTIVFTFNGNDHYLQDGTIEVPVNSLTLVTDNSQMANFKKSASNDIFISATYAELGMSKSELESWFKENACDSTGGCDIPSNLSEWTYDDNGNITSMVYTASTISDNEYHYGKLTDVTIGSGVTSIGNSAFNNCYSLSSCTIGNSVTNIGSRAFESCASLTSIDIPSGVTSIGNKAFGSCISLTSINLPSGVTSIGEHAFNGCRNLIRLNSDVDGVFNLPSGVTSINIYVFYGCSGLTSINIPTGVTSIGSNAFENCSNLTGITIPYSVTSIGKSTFLKCTGLTSVRMPSSVTSIGDYAFNVCSSLTSVTIPKDVTSIGSSAFRDCSSLTSVVCNATTPPTLGFSVFDNTNNCPIYVPSASVAAYKSASIWNSYASRIQAIP